MSIESTTDREAADERGPRPSGDLASVLDGGPMFRRVLAGYDRFQVDTYVRWAEDELTAADRQREQLLTRELTTRAALTEARDLLAHSAGGAEFLRVSRRIGSLLAAAADEAENMRAEAENRRSVACAQAEVLTTDARRVLAEAQATARELVSAAAAEVAAMTAGAGRVVAEAERVARDVRADAAAHLDEGRAVEQRARAQAAQLLRQAVEEAQAARLAARADAVRVLATAREQRRRVDAESTALRERLDREAGARREALLAETAELERRCRVLRVETEPAVVPSAAGPRSNGRSYLERLPGRLGRAVLPRGRERTAA